MRTPVVRFYGDAPWFRTKHEAAEFLETHKRGGLVKRCVHAKVTVASTWDITGYAVRCHEESFNPVDETANHGESFLSAPFRGCPKQCRLYRSRWRGAVSKWHSVPGHWFNRQPWQVRVAIISAPLLALVVLVALLRGELLSLIQAIGTVWDKIRSR